MENRGDRRLWVRPAEMALELSEKSPIAPGGATAAATAGARTPPGGSAFGFTPTTTQLAHPGYTAAALVVFLPLIIMEQSRTVAENDRFADYSNKDLKERILGKDESVNGFVYFVLPPGTQSFDEATLVLKLVDLDEAKYVVVRLPLTGLGFKGTPAAAEPGAKPAEDGNR